MRRAALAATLRASTDAGQAPWGLAKNSSNLFRDRRGGARQRLDLSAFCHVLELEPAQGWIDVEGMMTYEALVDQLLPQGVMPAVVPQLRSITVGGAISGCGIEATSHQEGLVHHGMLELDVMLSSGQVVCCTADNQHSDLFHGFPGSYGTLGYALRVRLRTLPVKPFVKVEHLPFDMPSAFFQELGRHCQKETPFVDGVVFGQSQQIINIASFVDQAPWVSDYSYEHIYYRSLPVNRIDFMRTQDYLWRWDTDWFWCSKNIYAQHPLVRRLLGRKRLNSRTYQRIMRWNSRWGLTKRVARLLGRYPESVIQDVDIPMANAPVFLEFLLKEIGIVPIWICPVQAKDAARQFTLFPMKAGALYLNFGFWDVVQSSTLHEPGHFNRLVEKEVMRLDGIKSLYSDSFFTPEEFARLYNMTAYQALKNKYDPGGRLLGLYDKCVLRA